MSQYFTVLALALLPAVGNAIGSLLAESVRTPKRLIGAALHSAGIAIALVSIDLMPRILQETALWFLVTAFPVERRFPSGWRVARNGCVSKSAPAAPEPEWSTRLWWRTCSAMA
jgi:hypothetical protein